MERDGIMTARLAMMQTPRYKKAQKERLDKIRVKMLKRNPKTDEERKAIINSVLGERRIANRRKFFMKYKMTS